GGEVSGGFGWPRAIGSARDLQLQTRRGLHGASHSATRTSAGDSITSRQSRGPSNGCDGWLLAAEPPTAALSLLPVEFQFVSLASIPGRGELLLLWSCCPTALGARWPAWSWGRGSSACLSPRPCSPPVRGRSTRDPGAGYDLE